MQARGVQAAILGACIGGSTSFDLDLSTSPYNLEI